MSQTYKSIIAVCVAIAFMAMAVICCCVVKDAFASAKKCSHCASSKADTSSHECCFSKASPMETAKTVFQFLPLLVFAVLSFLYLRPVPQFAYQRISSNSPPPGSVPLYIRSRSLRI